MSEFENDQLPVDKTEKLKELAMSLKETNLFKKKYEEELKTKKDEFKELASELGVDSYKDEFVKVSISDIEKISFDTDSVIVMLRDKGLEKYIHTKEYIDESELAIAITKNELRAEDIKPFMSETHEKRINIK